MAPDLEDNGDALGASWRMQEAASRLGFDWPEISGVFAKVREEVTEIEDAWAARQAVQARDELGDLLFAAVNLARFLGADPAEALTAANARFAARFALVEEEVLRRGWDMRRCTLEQLDEVWEWAKERLRSTER